MTVIKAVPHRAPLIKCRRLSGYARCCIISVEISEITVSNDLDCQPRHPGFRTTRSKNFLRPDSFCSCLQEPENAEHYLFSSPGLAYSILVEPASVRRPASSFVVHRPSSSTFSNDFSSEAARPNLFIFHI